MTMQIGITAEQAENMLAEKAALSNKGTGSDGNEGSKKEDGENENEDNIPFHKHPRFQQLARENREFKAKMAEITKNQEQAVKEAKKEFVMDPEMPFDEAIKQIKREAAQEALELFRAEQNKANEQTSFYENLINDGFDYLRDNGHKISAKDEDAIAEIALKYKINIEAPEDLEKAYDIYSLSRKNAGTGKAQEDSITTKDRKVQDKGAPIDYSQTSWSSLSGRIAEKLGVKSDLF